MHRPGVERGPHRWQRCILPLEHRCCCVQRRTLLLEYDDPSAPNGWGVQCQCLCAHGESGRAAQDCQCGAIEPASPTGLRELGHAPSRPPLSAPFSPRSTTQGPAHSRVLRCPAPRAPLAHLCKMQRPGIEPGSHRRQRCILPLDHRCGCVQRSTLLFEYDDPSAPNGGGVQCQCLCAHGGSPRLTMGCLLYTSPSPRDLSTSRMPSSA